MAKKVTKLKTVAKPRKAKKEVIVENRPPVTVQRGKIRGILFGQGGKDNSCFGFNFYIGSDKDGWGIHDFWGTYYTPRPENAVWSEDDRLKNMGNQCFMVNQMLIEAKKTNVLELVNCPVEVTFDGDNLVSWRLLSEVL